MTLSLCGEIGVRERLVLRDERRQSAAIAVMIREVHERIEFVLRQPTAHAFQSQVPPGALGVFPCHLANEALIGVVFGLEHRILIASRHLADTDGPVSLSTSEVLIRSNLAVR